jgi:predicted Mrr-cat superfamily restriction endonuclease
MTRKIWVIRPEPNFINRMADFLDKGIVAIGWPGVGDLGGGITRDDIKNRLCDVFEHYRNELRNELAVAAGVLDRFVNLAEVGDYFLVPNGDEVYVSEVLSPYEFHPELDSDGPDAGYPHWRRVKYLKDGKPYCRIKELPLGVRRAVDCRLTVFSVTSAANSMWRFLGMEPVPEPGKVI